MPVRSRNVKRNEDFEVKRSYGSVEEWLADVPSRFDLDRLKTMATNGWHDGVEQIRKYTYSIDNVVGARINEPAINWDVTGVSWDMGEALTGNPECWYDFRAPEHKLVRVMYNPSASAWVSPKGMALRGAMVAGLVDCLEKAGHRVELWMTYGNTGDHGIKKTVRAEVMVKPADMPLDIDKIAFLCVHEKCLRGLWFALITKIAGIEDMSYLPTLEDAQLHDIVVDRLDEDMSEVDVIAWVTAQLKAFGVELE